MQKTYMDIIGVNLLGEVKLFGVVKEIEYVLREIGINNMSLQEFEFKKNFLINHGYIETFSPKIINTIAVGQTPYFEE